MNEAESKIQVGTPLFLITSSEPCWKCHRSQSVISFASRSLRDDDIDMLDDSTEDDEPFLLTDITEMPVEIYEQINAIHARYRKHFSRTVQHTYYANMCECGANFGDFYLHSEPGGAFFPQDVEQAAQMRISQLPFEGVFDFQCSYSQGLGRFIFEHAQRI